LKSWRFRGRLTIAQYVNRGLGIMLNPVVTGKGKRALGRVGEGAVRSTPAAVAPARRAVRKIARVARA
jgi:TetR/AcrR family transcriptional regulator, cholesterol catabolism regulator